MNKKHIISEEDRQWLLENPLPDTPGLFSKSPIWFKHSAYDIKEVNRNLYICPSLGSTLTTYKPFEKYLEIMKDFMALLVSIDKLPKEFDEGSSNEERAKLFKKRDYDYAKLILEFTCKYGPLGMMYEHIESLDPCRKKDGEDDFENYIVVLDRKVYSIFPLSLQNKMLPSYTKEGIFNFTPIIKYDDLCSYFLPNTKKPYPQIKSKEFREGYSERVNDIVLDHNIDSLTRHMLKMNKFFSKSYKPNDKVPENEKNYKGSIEWGDYLRQSFGDIGLTFGFDKATNKWDLNWNFKSLIGALSIMYLMNLTGRMGSNIHMCKYSKCDIIVIDKNCCCEKHDNAYRKAKERANKE